MNRTLPAVVAALVLVASEASAGNDEGVLMGAEAAMVGGAVTATIGDATALWYNPAGLARATGDKLEASASAFTLRRYAQPTYLASMNGDRESAAVTEIVPIPSALGYLRRSSESFAYGWGLFVPSEFDISLRSAIEFGNDAGGTTKWQFGQSLVTSTLVAAAGVGWKLRDDLRFGAGVHGVYQSFEVSQVLNGGRRAGDGTPLAVVTTSTLADSARFGVRANAGIQYDPTPTLSLGFMARSPSIELATVRSQLDSLGVGESSAGIVDFTLEDDADTGRETSTMEVATVALGAALTLTPDVRVMLEASMSPANEDLDRSTVWNARAGANLAVTETLALGAGAFTDRSAASNGLDVDFYGGTLGVRFQNGENAEVDDSDAGLRFESFVGLRYAHGSGRSNNLTVRDVVFQTNEDLVLEGQTPITVHELSLNVGSGLQF